jgi:hypothetical protein
LFFGQSQELLKDLRNSQLLCQDGDQVRRLIIAGMPVKMHERQADLQESSLSGLTCECGLKNQSFSYLFTV